MIKGFDLTDMFWLRVEPTGPGCVQPGRSQQKMRFLSG